MTEWIALATAFISAVGLFFAGHQSRLSNRRAQDERRLALEGVVVFWQPVFAPAHPDADGGGEWTYDLTVENPGQFPIDEIKIAWHFDLPVQRVRYDDSLDSPTKVLNLAASVLPGGRSLRWTRTLRMNFAEATRRLPETYAIVAFHDVSRNPRGSAPPSGGL